MELTSAAIKQRAKELGIDDIAIGNIERFEKAPALLSPKNYFPGCRSIIALMMRIPRGSYRGIEEGTHWHNYTYYSYNRLNTVIRPRLTYELSRFIEDTGWEAVPHYPAVPERHPTREPVASDRYPPDIVPSIRIIAAGCGLGEIGHAKVFLNKKFGPRLRLGLIFTDAVLEPDPILDEGTICLKCGACAKDCPGNAVPAVNDKTKKRLVIDFGEKKVSYGDVHMGRCTLTHHGMNNTISPFHKKAFPGMALDVCNSDMTEEEAYRLCYPVAQAKWQSFSENKSDAIIEYYDYVINHGGYFALCGARSCIRSCMDRLEKAKRIENIFKEPFFKKKSWLMDYRPDQENLDHGINQFREKYLDKKYPGVRKGEYKTDSE